MNTIESILNDIDELLEGSWSLPLSGGRCVVDAEKVRDLIDSIRMNMPAEIKQARAVVADRNQILSLAKERQRRSSARRRNGPSSFWSRRASCGRPTPRPWPC